MSEPKARPIIMSGWSVPRILADEKTNTRRPIKPQAHSYNTDILDPWVLYPREDENDTFGDPSKPIRCPYGKPGDLLWVRETWVKPIIEKEFILYRATASEKAIECTKWKPSIFMPKWASRITLRIKDIRVERVKDITNEDCAAEGCRPLIDDTGIYDERVEFCELWDSIYAKTFPWESSPWVWAIDFIKEERT